MGRTVPIDLLRLRSATAAYLFILRDVVAPLDAIMPGAGHPEGEGWEAMAELRESMHAALDVCDAPGTLAAILRCVARLIGEA